MNERIVARLGQQRFAGDQHDVAQIAAIAESFGEQGITFGRGDQHPNVAVAHDVADLLWLEQRVERDEYAACGRGTKTGNNIRVVKVDGSTPASALICYDGFFYN